MRPSSSLSLLAALAVQACFYSPSGAPVDTASTTEDVGTDTDATDGQTDPTTGGGLLCGDAAMDPGEQCDYGAANNGVDGSVCRSDCSLNVCGDGYLAITEGCDDGNVVYMVQFGACCSNSIIYVS